MLWNRKVKGENALNVPINRKDIHVLYIPPRLTPCLSFDWKTIVIMFCGENDLGDLGLSSIFGSNKLYTKGTNRRIRVLRVWVHVLIYCTEERQSVPTNLETDCRSVGSNMTNIHIWYNNIHSRVQTRNKF